MSHTIAAISSGLTASGIGIVRISGPEAFRVLGRIFVPPEKIRKAGKGGKSETSGKCLHVEKDPKAVLESEDHSSGIDFDNCGSLSSWKPNTVHYGYIADSTGVIDECLVLYLPGPHTYTTEDTAEIDCHGGPYVMQRVLHAALNAGALLAEPGEFTKKAFLGGRIDLSEAEAVMDVIRSKSEDALKSSISQLSGAVKNKITELRTEIMDELAYIEAALDDPEHYDLTGYPEELLAKIIPIENEVQALAASYSAGRVIREGIATAIIGKPNAGKSSLLNYLSGSERAIVTDIPGTTRDVVEEQVRFGGLFLRVMDTAGIRDTGDAVEKIGVGRALKAADEADLVFLVIDGSEPLGTEDRKLLAYTADKRTVVILNKNDLHHAVSAEDIRAYTEAPVVQISAKMETGADDLQKCVRDMYEKGGFHFNEEVMITSERQHEALVAAAHSLALVRESIANGLPEDFFSIDLMDAYRSLGKIIGEDVGDDLVNTIFSKFCMGK